MTKIVATFVASLFALVAFGCVENKTTPPSTQITIVPPVSDTMPEPSSALEISLEVLEDLVTDNSAWVVVKMNKPGKYDLSLLKIVGVSYESVGYSRGEMTTDAFLPQWYYSPENPLDSDTPYLVKMYAWDENGNVAGADATFRTKPAPTTQPTTPVDPAPQFMEPVQIDKDITTSEVEVKASYKLNTPAIVQAYFRHDNAANWTLFSSPTTKVAEGACEYVFLPEMDIEIRLEIRDNLNNVVGFWEGVVWYALRVSNLQISDVTPLSAKVSWVANQTSYIQVQYGPGGLTKLVEAQNSGTVTLKSLVSNTDYQVEIVAVNQYGHISTATGGFKTKPFESCSIMTHPNIGQECLLLCKRERANAPMGQLICLVRPEYIGWTPTMKTECADDADGDGIRRTDGDLIDSNPYGISGLCEGAGNTFGFFGGADCQGDVPVATQTVFCDDIGVTPNYTLDSMSEWQGWYNN